MRSLLAIAMMMFLVTGCGYRPSKQYARSVVGERVSTQVVISMQDPENTVLIKDALDAAVITRFGSSITPRSDANTHLKIALQNVEFTPLQYDINGYIISYRTRITLHITRTTPGQKEKAYNAMGTYDFTIEPNAIISDQVRYDAIHNSGLKAIDSFAAQVAAEGTRSKE